jgi:hypothetical protein
MPAALAAVDTNAKPMLKMFSRDSDRNIIASAGKLGNRPQQRTINSISQTGFEK